MTEEELRNSLRSTMATVSPPPPMSTTVMVAAAKRARVRRRAAWTCAGSAVLVAALVGGAVMGGGTVGLQTAGSGPQLAPGPGGAGTDTAEPWPTGPDGQPQQDRTARAGARYDKGVQLLDAVLAAVPEGYSALDVSAGAAMQHPPSPYHQAQFDERVNGVEVWSYQAYTAITSGEGTGRVLAEVYTAGNRMSGEPCGLAQQFWGMRGECEEVTVGGARIGVVVRSNDDRGFDQWAAYRHPDGVVVFVAQARTFDDVGQPLAALPFSVEDLAALAVQDEFHLQ